jgi:hypothetical protein
MRQVEINRAVSRATGETVTTIKRLGFLIADPAELISDPDSPELGGRVLDWDEFDQFRGEHDEEPFDQFAIC